MGSILLRGPFKFSQMSHHSSANVLHSGVMHVAITQEEIKGRGGKKVWNDTSA